MTLSKEKLEKIAELARKENYKPCAMHMTNLIAVCDSEVIEEMARRLLAVEGQEPVAWMVIDLDTGEKIIRADRSYIEGSCTPLYTAPQPAPVAQSVPVPEQVPESLKDRLITICDVVEDNEEYCQDIWNACRAAMLKAEPVSQPYKLPEGWKLVPVEPTMGMLDEFDSIIDYGAEDSKDAWSRMLAAAPQEPTK